MHESRSLRVMPSLRSVAKWAGLFALICATAGVAGCTAEVGPAAYVPADYYAYPYTYYDGHVVYYVQGNWYYPYGNRWYTYRRVPPDLARQTGSLYYYRAPYGQYRAPPAYGRGYERAPSGRGYERAPQGRAPLVPQHGARLVRLS